MINLFLAKKQRMKKNMKNNPLISVVVPVYNTEKYLAECLSSIIDQTYKNLEIVLIDDGSTDGSGKICDEYAKKDSRIVVVHQKNGGQSSARNKGLKIIHGKYVAMIDSDDKVMPNFIEKLLSAYSDKKCSLSLCGILYRKLFNGTEDNGYAREYHNRKKNESIKEYVLHSMSLDGRLYSVINKLFVVEIIHEKNLLFEEGRNFGEDTMFVLNYIDVMGGEINISTDSLYIYNFGTESSTVNKSGVIKENWDQLYKDVRKWLGKKPNIKERFWLTMLGLRWKISYIRSKKRAKKVNS